MRKEDIKKGKYYLAKNGDIHRVRWLFDTPEYNPVIKRTVIGQAKNITRGFTTRFSSDYFIKEVSKEEYPEYFI
jgi:hypothetical protein